MSNIARKILEEPIPGRGTLCVLTFDKPGSAANTLDRATLEELEEHLDFIESDPGIGAVVLMSAKDGIFVAGADLGLLGKAMSGAAEGAVLERYLELGQQVFNQLAGLSVPTVAAIHGACVGGGYELALACDYRIATPDKATKIGLPETKLGILPAWGGSTRLPRLIGVLRALDILLGGKTPPAKQALRLGMIDRIAPREWLMRSAIEMLKETRMQKKRTRFFQAPLNRAMAILMGGRVRADVLRRTRGHYPAVLKALEVVLEGAGEGHTGPSLAREREAVVELAGKEECRNLFRVFMLQERARKLVRHELLPPGAQPEPIRTAAVIGAGIMGAGIAQWLSARGVRVMLRDIDSTRVGAGMARIFKLYDDAVKRHLMTPLEARDGIDRIAPMVTTVPTAAEAPMSQVQLVIEAAVEKLAIKSQIFAALDALTPPDTVLATNTSALPVSQIAQATSHPGRVLGLHFFNPVHRMQLVEVVLPAGVDPAMRRRALRFLQQIGKLPVVVRDTPGFLVNRILLPYLMEAASAFDAGLGAAAIDEGMLDFGMPMGPLRLVDEVGLDIALDVANTLATAFPERMRVPSLLTRMVEAGLLGRKSGRGFYIYNGAGAGKGSRGAGAKAEPLPNSGANKLRGHDDVQGGGHPAPDADQARSRMVYRMLDEAARCLDERVAEAPEDVDFAMIMGTGFPPFRGGPLRYADSLGAGRVVQEMEALGLKPCGRLTEMAAKTRKFYEHQERE